MLGERSVFCIFKPSIILETLSRLVCLLGIVLNATLIFAEDTTILGPAELYIKDIRLCDDPGQYPSSINVYRTKINRTLESFKGNVSLHTDLDDTVTINANVAKWGDGGYKPNYYISEDKVCDFFFRWVGKDLKQALRELNQPEKCPIKKGLYIVKGYLVNYNELPKEMVYGEFRATVLFIQNNVDILCYQWIFTSKPKMPGLL